MYRVVTHVALSRSIPIADESAVTALAEQVRIDFLPPGPEAADGRQYTVRADGADVTWGIRSRQVDESVSPVSAYARVREAMTSQQRRIGLLGRVVMVGRDIGTVVLPEAGCKIYLDATQDERARRRLNERLERGESADFDSVLAEIQRRDQIDSSRSVAPLKQAADAVYLDSTGQTVVQVLDRVVKIVEDARRVPGPRVK